MRVLQDSDIDRIPIRAFVDSISEFIVADFEGRSTAPPRQSIAFPSGSIVFTSGGIGHVAGFRAYESFRSPMRRGEDQVVAVWDTNTCSLKAVCVGSRLGALRTGVIGGLAVNILAPPSALRCALIGTGRQAETQLLGILACRPLSQVRVYSRQKAHRDEFARRMSALISASMVLCDTAEEAATGAEIVVLATDSETPVIDPAALIGAAHITTVGPKSRKAHELPLAAAVGRLLVSDSPQQIRAQGEQHMLFEHADLSDVEHLGKVISLGRAVDRPRSLYLSAGLGGTEVVALAAALEHIGGHE